MLWAGRAAGLRFCAFPAMQLLPGCGAPSECKTLTPPNQFLISPLSTMADVTVLPTVPLPASEFRASQARPTALSWLKGADVFGAGRAGDIPDPLPKS